MENITVSNIIVPDYEGGNDEYVSSVLGLAMVKA